MLSARLLPRPLLLGGALALIIVAVFMTALLLAALGPASPAAAQTTNVDLVSNTGQADDTETFNTGFDYETSFTTGVSGEGYTLTAVDLALETSGPTLPTYTMQIVNASGTSLGTLTNPSSFSVGRNRHSAPGSGIDLEPNTTYRMVMDVTGGTSGHFLASTASDAEDAGRVPGWRIADTMRYKPFGSSSWGTHSSILKFAIRGHAKDQTAPKLRNARVDGSTLTLHYNERLDTGSTPAGSDFTVSVAGTDQTPTAVSVASSVVTLTLGTAATAGQAVTVTYTAGTNPVRDLAANSAGNLSGRAVVNTTGETKPAVESDGVAVVSTPSTDADTDGTPDTYGPTERIRVRLTFDEAVTVDTTAGRPRLQIKMDQSFGEKWAGYEGGSGTTELTFGYTAVSGNTSTQGIAVLQDTLELNGGLIDSAATEHVGAALTHGGLTHDATHKVDTTSLSDTTAPEVAYAEVDRNELKLTFTEALDESSTPSSAKFSVSATSPDGTTTDIAGSALVVEIAGRTVTVALTDWVPIASTVTVAYTGIADSATDPLQDTAATPNKVADFSGQPATNRRPKALNLLVGTVHESAVKLYFDHTLDTTVSAPDPGQFTLSPSLGTVSNVTRSGRELSFSTANASVAGTDYTLTFDNTAGVRGRTANCCPR